MFFLKQIFLKIAHPSPIIYKCFCKHKNRFIYKANIYSTISYKTFTNCYKILFLKIKMLFFLKELKSVYKHIQLIFL